MYLIWVYKVKLKVQILVIVKSYLAIFKHFRIQKVIFWIICQKILGIGLSIVWFLIAPNIFKSPESKFRFGTLNTKKHGSFYLILFVCFV